MTQELELEFVGGGESVGFTFKQKVQTPYGYIYEVSDEDKLHYEVFERVVVSRYDFINKCDVPDEFKVSYPTSNAFGFWAWTTRDYNRAIKILKEIEAKVKFREEQRQEQTQSLTTPEDAYKTVSEAEQE